MHSFVTKTTDWLLTKERRKAGVCVSNVAASASATSWWMTYVCACSWRTTTSSKHTRPSHQRRTTTQRTSRSHHHANAQRTKAGGAYSMNSYNEIQFVFRIVLTISPCYGNTGYSMSMMTADRRRTTSLYKHNGCKPVQTRNEKNEGMKEWRNEGMKKWRNESRNVRVRFSIQY